MGKLGKLGTSIAASVPVDQDPSAKDRKVWLVVAIVSAVLTVLMILVTLVMIKRIKVRTKCSRSVYE